MKRLVAGLLVLGLLATILVAPTPAFAGGRHRHWGGHRGGGGGHFVGGLALGAVTGVILGGILAPRPVYAEPPVVYQPAPVYVPAPPPPVYVAPPPPVCTDYWVPDHYRYGTWVQGHWVRTCR